MSPVRWLDWPDAPKGGGAADYFKAGGTVEGLAALIREVPAEGETTLAVIPTWNLISSLDLAKLELPEPKWAVPGIVPEGVLLVAGKPKFGKSWWVLDLCAAIVQGGTSWGRVSVERGEVLYVTFEDSLRRIQDRQQRVLGHPNGIPGLDFVTDCPRSDEGGIENVLAWVKAHPRARLIVLDPLERWRPVADNKQQLMHQDYESIRPIVELARALGISVIVVHHCNKLVNPDDPFDSISGSTGLTAAADAIGVFKAEKGMADGVLFLKGKDVDFAELAFKMRVKEEYPAPAWELLGSGAEYRMSRERFETMEALWREPWQTPASLAEVMDPPVPKGRMRVRLFDMARDGLLRINDGKYAAGIEKDAYLHKFGHDADANTPLMPNATNASDGLMHESGTKVSKTGVSGISGVSGIRPVSPVSDPHLKEGDDDGDRDRASQAAESGAPEAVAGTSYRDGDDEGPQHTGQGATTDAVSRAPGRESGDGTGAATPLASSAESHHGPGVKSTYPPCADCGEPIPHNATQVAICTRKRMERFNEESPE